MMKTSNLIGEDIHFEERQKMIQEAYRKMEEEERNSRRLQEWAEKKENTLREVT